MTTPINSFRDVLDAMERDLGHLVGVIYEEAVAPIAHRLVRRNLGLADAVVVARSLARNMPLELPDVDLAAGRGDIAWDEADDLVMADVVVSGTGPDGEPCYVLAQVSVTVQGKDRARALRRAGLLEKATGVTTIPVVIGVSEEAPEGDSGVVFWQFDPDV